MLPFVWFVVVVVVAVIYNNCKIQGDHFLENMEMSENFTAVRESQGIDEKSELSGKRSCPGKLFIVNIMFGVTPVFISLVLA